MSEEQTEEQTEEEETVEETETQEIAEQPDTSEDLEDLRFVLQHLLGEEVDVEEYLTKHILYNKNGDRLFVPPQEETVDKTESSATIKPSPTKRRRSTNSGPTNKQTTPPKDFEAQMAEIEAWANA